MALVTAAEVRVIFDTELSDDIVEAHIDIADNLVATALASSGLDSTRLKNIERYVSAHLLSLRDRLTGMVAAEWVSSEAKVEFSSEFGQMLHSTHFGQMAILLDTSGTLSKLGKTQAVFRAY